MEGWWSAFMLLGRQKEYVTFHISATLKVLMIDKMRHVYTLLLHVLILLFLFSDSWFLQGVNITPCWPGNYYFGTFWCGRKCAERLHWTSSSTLSPSSHQSLCLWNDCRNGPELFYLSNGPDQDTSAASRYRRKDRIEKPEEHNVLWPLM